MGTSAAHRGPNSGVSFDPPWLDDIEVPNYSPDEDDNEPEVDSLLVPALAPPARFGGARRNLNDYFKSGNRDSLRRALGHYSRTGMGGARRIATRMQPSVRVAVSMVAAFVSLRNKSDRILSDAIRELRNSDTDIYSIIDAIVSYVCPDGGSIDETSSRDSASSALSDLFERNPRIDINALSDDDIWSLLSSYLGYEAFSRVQIDIGQNIESKQTLGNHLNLLNGMREYLESEIAAQLNVLRNKTSGLVDNLRSILSLTIERTFTVFEAYL